MPMNVALTARPLSSSWIPILCPRGQTSKLVYMRNLAPIQCKRYKGDVVNAEKLGPNDDVLLSSQGRDRLAPGAYIDPLSENIVLGDLEATLEKHRAAKTDSYFRKTYLGLPTLKSIDEIHIDDTCDPVPLVESHQALGGKVPEERRRVRGKTQFIKSVRWQNHFLHSKAMVEGLEGAADTSSFKIGLQRNFQVSRHATQPWLPETKVKRSETRQTRFHQELEKIARFLALTPDEERVREATVHQLIHILEGSLPELGFTAFGSLQTGLATSLSDIDVAVTIPVITSSPNPSFGNPRNRKTVYNTLRKIESTMSTKPEFRLDGLIHANLPLLRVVHKTSKADIQLVYQRKEVYTTEIINKYLEGFPISKPLFFILRSLPRTHDLHSARTGGVGSYPTFMMIITAIKFMETSPKSDLPLALLEVLNFWATFDTRAQGVSLEPAETFAKVDRKLTKHAADIESATSLDPGADASLKVGSRFTAAEITQGRHKIATIYEEQPYLLCMQDPGDPMNDLGRKAFRFLHVRKLCGVLAWHIEKWLSGELLFPNSLSQLLFGDGLRPYRERRAQVLNLAKKAEIEQLSLARDSVTS